MSAQSGHAKINVDGAFARRGTKGAAVALCRDVNGAYVGASTTVANNITDPPCLQALACREGVALAGDLNLRSILVASDCLVVVKDIEQ